MSMIAAYLAGLYGFGPAISNEPGPAGLIGASPEDPATALPVDGTAAVDDSGDDLLEQAEALVRDGRPHEALPLLATYLQNSAVGGSERHSRALFLLSDLRQMTGEVETALTPLFQILRYPPSQATAERARQRLALLVNAREQQLINAEDYVGLVSYFEYLVSEDPAYDGHRLKLARWLLKSGDAVAAEQVIRQTGTMGVTQAEIEALASEIRAELNLTLPQPYYARLEVRPEVGIVDDADIAPRIVPDVAVVRTSGDDQVTTPTATVL